VNQKFANKTVLITGGFTALSTYRQVWRRATGRDKPQS
jgi:hypothetical protein